MDHPEWGDRDGDTEMLPLEVFEAAETQLDQNRLRVAQEIAGYVAQSTAAQGLDYYAVEVCGLSAAEWARVSGERDRSTVSRNVRRARESIED